MTEQSTALIRLVEAYRDRKITRRRYLRDIRAWAAKADRAHLDWALRALKEGEE